MAAKAGPAVARAHADRAEQTHVVQVHRHGGARRAGGLEPARAHQRKHVVHVHHVGAEARHGGGHVALVAPAAQQRTRRARPARLGRATLEQRVRHAGPAQRGELQLHRALLAALDAVAVVDDQDAHPPGYAIRPMDPPAVTVVVPTRGRAAYLEVTLRSLLAQRTGTAHELLVVDDGSADDTRAVAARLEVRCVSHGEPRSLNAARNTGLRESGAPLVAFVDDDVQAPPGWLDALAEGARAHPAAEAFGGPIRARIEGGGPRGCGREEPPITALDLGPEDREADMVWGANFAVRRSAVERIGPFDERIVRPHGDEEEWLERLRAAGGRIVYLAAAGLDHRRSAEDARLRRLARAAYARGRAARASDRRRGRAPGLGAELRVLAGCGWHTVRRACPQGVVMGAQAAGRVAEALRPLPAREGRPR